MERFRVKTVIDKRGVPFSYVQKRFMGFLWWINDKNFARAEYVPHTRESASWYILSLQMEKIEYDYPQKYFDKRFSFGDNEIAILNSSLEYYSNMKKRNLDAEMHKCLIPLQEFQFLPAGSSMYRMTSECNDLKKEYKDIESLVEKIKKS